MVAAQEGISILPDYFTDKLYDADNLFCSARRRVREGGYNRCVAKLELKPRSKAVSIRARQLGAAAQIMVYNGGYSMSIGAVIVAAGMSSRMGDFKPMLSIGSQSIARRLVSTLRQAGAEEIVMITGHNADALERHLEGCGLTFIRNKRALCDNADVRLGGIGA